MRVAAFALLVPALVRLPLPALERVLEPRSNDARADAAEAERLAGRVDAALARVRRVGRRTCLVRGLTLYYFLRRAGVDVRLAFGLGRPHEAFEGHCWLVLDGEPFLEKKDPRAFFAETYSMPSVRS